MTLFGALLALSVLGKGFAKDAAKLPAARSHAPWVSLCSCSRRSDSVQVTVGGVEGRPPAQRP
jgi:hypothetical protein